MGVTAHPGKVDLLRWVFGRLDGLGEQRVLAHTRACASCRRHLVALIYAHRVVDVGGHVLTRHRRRLALAATVVIVAGTVLVAETGRAPRIVETATVRSPAPPSPPVDAAARLERTAGTYRLSAVEAQELIFHATGTRRLLTITRPGVRGDDGRALDEQIVALDRLIAGDAAAAVGAFTGAHRSRRSALVQGLSVYAAGLDDDEAARLIEHGVGDNAGGGLASTGHWVLGQLRLRQHDREGARRHWAIAAADSRLSIARIAAAALAELDSE